MAVNVVVFLFCFEMNTLCFEMNLVFGFIALSQRKKQIIYVFVLFKGQQHFLDTVMFWGFIDKLSTNL